MGGEKRDANGRCCGELTCHSPKRKCDINKAGWLAMIACSFPHQPRLTDRQTDRLQPTFRCPKTSPRPVRSIRLSLSILPIDKNEHKDKNKLVSVAW
jgi:hypothetical protein